MRRTTPVAAGDRSFRYLAFGEAPEAAVTAMMVDVPSNDRIEAFFELFAPF